MFIFELARGFGPSQVGLRKFGVFIADLDLRGGFQSLALLAFGEFRSIFGAGGSWLAGLTFLARAFTATALVAHLTFGNGRRGTAALALFALLVFTTAASAHEGRESGDLRAAAHLGATAAALLAAVPAGTLAAPALLLTGTLFVFGRRRRLSTWVFKLGDLGLFRSFFFGVLGTVEDRGIRNLG